MKTICVISFLCVLHSLSQARGLNGLENSKEKVAELSDKLRYSSQEAAVGFRKAMSRFDAAVTRHEMVKRDIESSYDINNVPESCRKNALLKLAEMKNKAIQEYVKCSGGTIFRAVGDSVQIVTTSLQLFTQIFQSIDDITNGFSDCYRSGIMHSIVCTVEALDTFGSDTKTSVDLAETYGQNITSLANDVTAIINVCQGEQKPKVTINLKELCSQNNDL